MKSHYCPKWKKGRKSKLKQLGLILQVPNIICPWGWKTPYNLKQPPYLYTKILNELRYSLLESEEIKRKPFTQFQRIPQHTNLHVRGLHRQQCIDYLIPSRSLPPPPSLPTTTKNRVWHSRRLVHTLSISSTIWLLVIWHNFHFALSANGICSLLVCRFFRAHLFLSRFNQLCTVVYLVGKAFVILYKKNQICGCICKIGDTLRPY